MGEGRQALGVGYGLRNEPTPHYATIVVARRLQKGNLNWLMPTKSIPPSSFRTEFLCLPRFTQPLPLCGIIFTLELQPRRGLTDPFLV